MKKKICKLKLTATGERDNLHISARMQFKGDGEDIALILQSILEGFELSPMEAVVLCAAAVEGMHPEDEAEEAEE
jgi:hypothetical protein